MKRVTPKLNHEHLGHSLWVGREKWPYYCDGCVQLRQPGGRVLRMVDGINGCTEGQFCRRCIRRLLKALS